LQLELAVCAEYRIFHTQFLSRSSDDRDKAIWWWLRKRKECPRCMTRPEEWDEDEGGHRRAYLPRIIECEGCIALERTEQAPEMNEGRGRSVGLIRNPDWE